MCIIRGNLPKMYNRLSSSVPNLLQMETDEKFHKYPHRLMSTTFLSRYFNMENYTECKSLDKRKHIGSENSKEMLKNSFQSENAFTPSDSYQASSRRYASDDNILHKVKVDEQTFFARATFYKRNKSDGADIISYTV